jgi:hypothetical protein
MRGPGIPRPFRADPLLRRSSQAGDLPALSQVVWRVSASVSDRCWPRFTPRSGTQRARIELSFTSWQRRRGGARRRLLAGCKTMLRRSPESGLLAALLAAQSASDSRIKREARSCVKQSESVRSLASTGRARRAGRRSSEPVHWRCCSRCCSRLAGWRVLDGTDRLLSGVA